MENLNRWGGVWWSKPSHTRNTDMLLAYFIPLTLMQHAGNVDKTPNAMGIDKPTPQVES